MLLVLAGLANAFCGTFVGAAGADLTNATSKVVIARTGTQTVLTLAADYEGELEDFALLVPVPEVLDAEDVKLVSSELIDRVDGWSVPRAVSYTCEELFPTYHDHSGMEVGCIGGDVEYRLAAEAGDTGGEGPLADDAVTVENQFVTGEYEISILSAEESEDLYGWLDRNGYAVPSGGEAILQEYIDAGVYFLAAKIRLDAVPEGRRYLTPLQLRYEADAWSLPIRIGTISSPGLQEVIVYALNAESEGAVRISNYPELEIEDECMWDSGETLDEYYDGQLSIALDAAGGAGWKTEYSWNLTQNCDPCTPEAGLTPEELIELGQEDYHAHLTRIRVRYRPTSVVSDLALYTDGIAYQSEQIRYIVYDPSLEAYFPICNVGIKENPGTCESGDPVEGPSGCHAAAGHRYGGLAALLVATALLRRRPSPRAFRSSPWTGSLSR